MAPTIISVSRRTDIPAFYGNWFITRLNEGFAGYTNPFNNKKYIISLKHEDIISFVFWTKNVIPFLHVLDIVEQRGYPFYLHYTINGYSKHFEPALPDLNDLIQSAIIYSNNYSRERIIWRYDPIIISDITSVSYHIDNFEMIASRLSKYVSHCYTSFVHHYKKAQTRFQTLYKSQGIEIQKVSQETQLQLLKKLGQIASKYDIILHTCSYPIQSETDIKKGSCIDLDLIHRLFYTRKVPPVIHRSPTRKGCGCYHCTDIGVYNTCLHDCLYCYANSDKNERTNLFRTIDENSPFLGIPKKEADMWVQKIIREQEATNTKKDPTLF